MAQDKDPFFALIQALTHAAYLSTPSQLKRLARVYSKRKIKVGEKLDVYLLLAQAPATATYWFELREAARRLAARLIEQDSVTDGVRRIAAGIAEAVVADGTVARGSPSSREAVARHAQRPRPRTPRSSQPRWWASSWRKVRSTCARSNAGSWPKSRSSVSW